MPNTIAGRPNMTRAARPAPKLSRTPPYRTVSAAKAVQVVEATPTATIPQPSAADALIAAKAMADKLDAILHNQKALADHITAVMDSVRATDVNVIHGSAYLINYWWTLWMAYLRESINDDPWVWYRPNEPHWA